MESWFLLFYPLPLLSFSFLFFSSPLLSFPPFPPFPSLPSLTPPPLPFQCPQVSAQTGNTPFIIFLCALLSQKLFFIGLIGLSITGIGANGRGGERGGEGREDIEGKGEEMGEFLTFFFFSSSDYCTRDFTNSTMNSMRPLVPLLVSSISFSFSTSPSPFSLPFPLGIAFAYASPVESLCANLTKFVLGERGRGEWGERGGGTGKGGSDIIVK